MIVSPCLMALRNRCLMFYPYQSEGRDHPVQLTLILRLSLEKMAQHGRRWPFYRVGHSLIILSSKHNLLMWTLGIPWHARNRKDELEAFALFLDPTMVSCMVKCTNKEAKIQKGDACDLHLDAQGLMAIIGLLIARGLFCGRNEQVEALSSKTHGRKIFPHTMPRDRFLLIMTFLRFDEKSRSRERRQHDKFCLI